LSAERLGRISRGRLLRRLARLAGPVVLANLSQSLMGLIDTLMVGRLGTAAIAAVGIGTLLFSALATTLRSLDVAVQTFTARREGEGRPHEVGAVLGSGLLLALVAGSIGTLAGMRWPHLGVGLVSGDPEVVRLGASYYFWRCAGLLPFLFFALTRSCFDGLGLTRVGMATSFLMNGLNVILNWVLIYGRLGAPAMGVGGAALASSLAGAVTALVILALALRPSVRRRHRLFGRGCVRRELLRPLLRVGWPQAAQGLGLVGGLVVFYAILGLVSTVAVAAGNVVMRLAAMCLMAAIGVGVAVQTLVSRCLGARDARGAWRTGLAGFCLAAALMALLGLPFLLWPDLVLSAFSVDEPVRAAGRGILRITALGQLLAAAGLVFAGVLRGAGATDRVLAVDVGTGAGFMLPVAWLFAVGLGGGLRGAWWALVLWFALHAVLMTRLFLRRRWLRIRL